MGIDLLNTVSYIVTAFNLFNAINYAIMALSLIVALVAIVISFYLYRWRRILVNKEHVLVPEKWAAILDRLSEVIYNHTSELKDVEGQLSTLPRILEEKEQEIKRLRQGYDYQIFKKFIKRFIRVDQAIAENQEIENLRLLLKDALEECQIHTFEPNIGDDYRKQGPLVADSPKTIETDDRGLDFKIASVHSLGYKFMNEAQEEILVPARVIIYIYKEKLAGGEG